MTIAYAPTPIRVTQVDPLFVAFSATSVQASGAVGPPVFWNHAAGGWEATFDPAKHVKPLTRLAAAGAPNGSYQDFSVPWDVANEAGVHALLYKRSTTGVYTPYDLRDGPTLAALSDAN